MGGALKLAVCTAGIYASYLTQGLVQEQLSTRRYGPQQERFSQLVFLNLAQAAVCTCWALLWLALRPASKDSAALSRFWLPALSNTVGPALGLIALKNISYTAQVLAKSCKLIPVMVAGSLLYGKRYSAAEYVTAVFVAGGIVLFALVKNSAAVMEKLAAPHAPVGYLLVTLNLALDAYTNSTQDMIQEHYPSTKPQQLMLYMNLWACVYYALWMFGVTGTGMGAVSFLTAHPTALQQVLLYCLCGAAGQQFIFMSISSFGAVTNVTITTTRKFFNVLLSVLYNKSTLRAGQWVGVVMVFTGLGQQIRLKRRGALRKGKQNEGDAQKTRAKQKII